MKNRNPKYAGALLIIVYVIIAVGLAGWLIYRFNYEGWSDNMSAWLAVVLVFLPVSGRFVFIKRRKAVANAVYAALPEVKISAKVFSKQQNIVTNHFPDQVVSEYSITFELHNGRRLIFPINKMQYGLWAENDEGDLIYKENDKYVFLINFQPCTRLGDD